MATRDKIVVIELKKKQLNHTDQTIWKKNVVAAKEEELSDDGRRTTSRSLSGLRPKRL